jgi:hypothetical protein
MALDPKAGALASSALPSPSGSPFAGLAEGPIARVAVILGKPAPRTPASDAPPEAGRDVGKAIVVCTAPDVCKTPIGSSTPPIPYQITGKLGDDANTSQNVFLTGLKAFKFDSVVTHVTGDEPGTATGIKSGTVGDIAEPKTASSVVRVNGQWLVRDGDSFWMNKRNTVGELIYKKDRDKYWPPADPPLIDDSEAEALLAKAQAGGAAISYYEADEEKTGKAKIASAANMAGFNSLLRTSLGEQPVMLAFLDTGKTPTVTDVPKWRPPATMPSSKLPKPTGGGGAKGNLIAVILLVVMPVGDHYAAIYEAKKALAGIEPQTPREQAIYDQAVEQLAAYKEEYASSHFLDSLLPWDSKGFHAFDAPARESVEKQIAEERARVKQTTAAPAPATGTSGGGGKDGSRITGDKDPCEATPYDENKDKCGTGEAAHHIIPDFILRVGTRLDPGLRMPGAPSLDKGPSICLNKDEHADVHRKIADGMREKINSNGTVTLQDVLDISIEALDEVKPDCKRQFEQAVRDAFKNIPSETLGRGLMRTTEELRELLTNAWRVE